MRTGVGPACGHPSVPVFCTVIGTRAASPANSNRVSIGYIRQDVPKTPDAPGHATLPAAQPHETAPAPAEQHTEPPGQERAAPAEANAASDYFHGHVPNYVTAVIVSYRAFDTMFETAVIFIAGLAMILFLRRRGPG